MSSTKTPHSARYIERRFALTLCCGMSIAATLTWWRGHTAAATVLAGIVLWHALAAIFFPRAVKPSRLAMEFIVSIVGTVLSSIILGLFYWLLLTPFALVWRLTGHDGLDRRRAGWKPVPDRENDPETLRRLW